MSVNLIDTDYAQVATDEILPDFPLFRGLSRRHRQILADCSELATFDPGEKIVETGELTDRFYLLTSGSVGLELPGETFTEKSQTLKPGDILGWSWLFPPYYWQFSAFAKEPTEAIFFSSSRLCQACDRDREFGFELFKRMSPATAALSSSRSRQN